MPQKNKTRSDTKADFINSEFFPLNESLSNVPTNKVVTLVPDQTQATFLAQLAKQNGISNVQGYLRYAIIRLTSTLHNASTTTLSPISDEEMKQWGILNVQSSQD